MSLADMFTSRNGVKPLAPKTSTSTIALTSPSNQYDVIVRTIKDIQVELLKDRGNETLAWIVGKLEVKEIKTGRTAFDSSTGMILYNPTYSARLVGNDRKEAVMKTILEALPGLNFGGGSSNPNIKEALDELVSAIVASIDNFATKVAPDYTGPQT